MAEQQRTGKFSNTRTVAELAAQDVYLNIAHNPNNGSYFLVQTDEQGVQIGSGSAGSISTPVMEELMELTPAQRAKYKTIPSDLGFVVSTITEEEEDEETGEITERQFLMLHKLGTRAPLFFGAPAQPAKAAVKKPVVKAPAKKIDTIF